MFSFAPISPPLPPSFGPGRPVPRPHCSVPWSVDSGLGLQEEDTDRRLGDRRRKGVSEGGHQLLRPADWARLLCFSQRGDIFCPEAHFYPLQWEVNNPKRLVSLLSIKLMHVSVYLYVVVVVKFIWSCPTLCDPMNSCQGPLSMEFPRQEYWSG